jgi:hypothetical protein
MKLTIHTTSDWTHVETTGTGDPKLWDYSTIPREFNSNIIVETDYVSIWIGKPQYDDTLTEVEVQLVSVNPSDIKINISKGYIGFTSIKVSYWDDEYLEIFRSTHTKTDGDPSHNRFNAKISQAQLMPYRINLAKPFIKQEKQILAIYYPWYGAPDSQSLGRHWGLVSVDDIEQSTDYPILSAYDSQNASLIRNHINIAAEYRVTGFAISWWGIDSYENRAFKKIVNTSNGFKACVYYEINRDGPSMSPEKVASELNYIIENYGYHENYLRYLEKPVILVFDAVDRAAIRCSGKRCDQTSGIVFWWVILGAKRLFLFLMGFTSMRARS